jgi:hypothetical protein
MAFPAELMPGRAYRAYLFQDRAGRATRVGASAAFTLTHSLP